MRHNLSTVQSTFEFGRKEYSVSELNGAIRDTLQRGFTGVWVNGEITEAKLAPSGHWYFSLKDASSKLRCVCYRSAAFRLRVKPKDGLEVAARGYIDVYEPRGEYQFIVEALQPRGFGALQMEFEQLKKKLEAEGLFAAARKRPLPRYPWRIGLVTSRSGAVIQDMLQVLTRRFPGLHIRLYPAQVQGAESVGEVCEALRYFSESRWPDVVIVGRGGGSLEDLWTFNTEFVARAIASSTVPVISAVGHETDFTIADFVADLRAATPSAAAELVIGTRRELIDRLQADQAKLERTMRFRIAQASDRLHRLGIERTRVVIARRVARASQRVDELDYRTRESLRARILAAERRHAELDRRLRQMDLRLRFADAHRRLDRASQALASIVSRQLAAHSQQLAALDARALDLLRDRLERPRRQHAELDARLRRLDLPVRFAEAHRRLDRAGQALAALIRRRLTASRARVDLLDAQARQLSPLAVLDRGYAVVTDPQDRVVIDPAGLRRNDLLQIRLAKGRLQAKVSGDPSRG